MSESRVLPHDTEAEECVLGACMLSSNAIEVCKGILTPSDFYRPVHGMIFDSICQLHANGSVADAVTVADQLKTMGALDDCGGGAVLVSMTSNTPAISSAARYAIIVSRHALGRSGIRIASEALTRFYDPKTDVGKYIDEWQSELKAIDSPALERPPEDMHVDDFMELPVEDKSPWVVEGLMREGWRALFVGREGDGKTTLTQSIAACAGYGWHALSHRPIKPARALIVDLENPNDVVHDRMKWFSDACIQQSRYETERELYIWHRPGGINLRRRTDRLALEDVIRRRRPNLVVLGPLYKAYSRLSSENDEQVAAEVQTVLDDLRTRYSFALIMEHHAPKGGGNGSVRELIPFGSSLWLRWSELGFSLIPDSREFPSKHLELKSYRGDRVKHAWPRHIEWGALHGSPFPWKRIDDKDKEPF